MTNPADDDFPALVAGLRARSPAHAAVMFHRFAPVVRRVLVRMLGVRDVEDLVQEVFLRVFDRIRRGSLRNPQALPAFVIAFATRTAKWELRRRTVRRIMQLSDTGDAPDIATTEPDADAREALRAFYAILDDLGAADRAAFVLRFLEQLEVQDVADALAVSRSTAKRRIGRAWQLVRTRLDAHPLLVDYARSWSAGRDGAHG